MNYILTCGCVVNDRGFLESLCVTCENEDREEYQRELERVAVEDES